MGATFGDFFKQKRSSIVALRDLKDKNKVKGKFGVALLKNDRIIDFQEKPEEPKSSLASTVVYRSSQKNRGILIELLRIS